MTSQGTVTGAAPADVHADVRVPLTLAVLALSGIGGSLLQTMASPALPAIAQDLSASVADGSWAMTALLLSAAITTPIIGRLGHLYGTRRTFVAVLATVAAGALTSALAPSLPVLIIGQALQGIAGGVFPLAFSTIRHTFPPHRRTGAIGLLSGLLGIGAGLGLVLSGLIVDNIGLRFIFWLPLVMIGVAIVMVARFLPDVPANATGGINWLSALLMATGLAGLLFSVTRSSAWGWLHPGTLGTAAAAIVAITVWLWWEHRSATPLVDLGTMRIRTVWATDLAGFFLGAAMFGAFILIPQLAQTDPAVHGFGFGFGVTRAGLLLAPLTLTMLAVGPLAGQMARRIGSQRAVALGAAAAVVSYGVLILQHDSVIAVLIASGILGAGIGASYAAMADLIVHAVPPDQTGVAAGVNTLARQLGSAFGASIAAAVLASDMRGGHPAEAAFTGSFAVALGAAVLAVIAAMLIPNHRR